ncbi:probable disease resistance protein At5g63020 isoform X2 [Euphorbia lathyris]|uniref:probable disease resistance protein At5g63020 isoform X2 n=1 Tax=Euphorbia lathyris TaxID=212925 RepID=UPI003314049B
MDVCCRRDTENGIRSLFPEDTTIPKNDLIDFWICEQLLGVKGPRGQTLCLGYNAIDTLIEAGLLEDEGECVKLLDMVRDCALKVAIKSQMFKNPQLLDPTDRETLETVGWISPMGNSIRNLANVPQNIFSFLLNHNPFIMIKGEFSQFMEALTVLDLSNSGVEEVPREISELVSLQYLNLSRTWIEQLPIELMMLGKLKCLNLEYDDQLRVIPKQLISNLTSLQVLKMFRCGFSVEEQEDNILSVRNMDIDPLLSLEHLKVLSITITCDSALQKFFKNPKLSNCTQSLSLEVFWDSSSLDISPLAAMKNLLTLEIHQAEKLKEINGNLHYSELPREGCFERLQKVCLGNCLSLQDLSWVILVPNLTVLMVKCCEDMEEIISDARMGELSEGREDLKPFAKLESLTLESLPNLESIYSKVLPFPCLKKIEVIECSLLRKLPVNSDCAKASEMIIEGEEEWWNDIQWEDDATKTTFVPCFKPLLFL